MYGYVDIWASEQKTGWSGWWIDGNSLDSYDYKSTCDAKNSSSPTDIQ